jgi:hypothetical protein
MSFLPCHTAAFIVSAISCILSLAISAH